MWTLLTFLVQMAFVETFLKPYLVKLTRFAVGKYVPAFLNRLDDQLPQWLVDCTPEELKDNCYGIINEVVVEMGEEPNPIKTEAILDLAVSTYSFLVNAGKVGRIE